MDKNAIVKVDRFKSVLNDSAIRAQVKNSLKESSGAFLSSMLELYSSDKYLQDCDPNAVANECLKAAFLGLPIVKSLGFAYIVGYKQVPTFIIGYKGLIQLAQRSGFYRFINADEVYEGELLSKEKLTGWIDISGERTSDKIVGYFAYFRLLNGFEKTFFMTTEEVHAHAKRYSPSYSSQKAGAWQTDFNAMAKKTVLRQLLKTYGPMSVELAQAMDQDENTESKVERTVIDNANDEVIDITPQKEEPQTTLDGKRPQPIAPKPDF